MIHKQVSNGSEPIAGIEKAHTEFQQTRSSEKSAYQQLVESGMDVFYENLFKGPVLQEDASTD
jgi:hypothetical protein